MSLREAFLEVVPIRCCRLRSTTVPPSLFSLLICGLVAGHNIETKKAPEVRVRSSEAVIARIRWMVLPS
ncbi:hypothetical protein CA54_20380 [Symmachiella macrocystis]|uniref:Uncharacterized protein n=1 Tax=Symmachiella macrocystis TaxID=2527985 RepID=A0A5C6BPK7_9PLAN|nr:hypothetical protein CA54_20380 [Symmachiella macrocystis]